THGRGMGMRGGGGGEIGGVPVVHTDDAATKLSDRARHRYWRWSNLSPGKVVLDYGLFERTHARPRPEQLPHKRGPL
ncbi:hypothetical protein FB451DRAFT_959766, partial [Mycena latifolia]